MVYTFEGELVITREQPAEGKPSGSSQFSLTMASMITI
jgi:hypothetical protein